MHASMCNDFDDLHVRHAIVFPLTLETMRWMHEFVSRAPRRILVNKLDFAQKSDFANGYALNDVALVNCIDDVLARRHFAEHGMTAV